jgi:predicted RNase H-like HicB family nuclease
MKRKQHGNVQVNQDAAEQSRSQFNTYRTRDIQLGKELDTIADDIQMAISGPRYEKLKEIAAKLNPPTPVAPQDTRVIYTAFVYVEGKKYLAEFPDCPGCQTFGDTMEKLKTQAQNALEGWLETVCMNADGMPPKPQKHEAPNGKELLSVVVSEELATELRTRWYPPTDAPEQAETTIQ